MRILPLVTLIAPFLIVPTALADTYQTLYLSATFQTADTLTGTLTIDEFGFFSSADLVSSGLYDQTLTEAGGGRGPYHGITTFQAYGAGLTLEAISSSTNFLLPPGSSLSLCNLSSPCGSFGAPPAYSYLIDAAGHQDPLLYGVLSTVAPTPEPSSIALLGTGMLGLAGVVRKRTCRLQRGNSQPNKTN